MTHRQESIRKHMTYGEESVARSLREATLYSLESLQLGTAVCYVLQAAHQVDCD